MPHSLEEQAREVRAWRQTKLHHFILSEARKVSSVSRHDHRVMLQLLIQEAWRNDPRKKENRMQWKAILEAAKRECKNAESIMTIVPDPYNGVLAKLSSMMLWNDESIRQWQFRYNDKETLRRKTAQEAMLGELQRQGTLFLKRSGNAQHRDPTHVLHWFNAQRNIVALP